MADKPKTDDNSNLVDMDDLAAFKAEFYETPKAEAEDVVEEDEPVEDEDHETEEDSLATDEDTDAAEADELEAEEEATPEPEPEPEAKPKAKKKSFQTRIDELVGDARQAERERDEARRSNELLLKRIEDLEARVKVEPEPIRDRLPEGAPDPDALDEQGNPVYPLGEFDKNYIRDITKFTIAQETKAAKEQAEAEAQASEIKKVQDELKANWETKLSEAEDEVPEIRENIKGLVDVFGNLDPKYGEYLAMTLMACDNGPAIMNYLSQNIGEAQKIVASGVQAATLAIGRLDDRFDRLAAEEEKTRNKRKSEAPPPPSDRVRGRVARTPVRGDTDDLAAFKREFYGQ